MAECLSKREIAVIAGTYINDDECLSKSEAESSYHINVTDGAGSNEFVTSAKKMKELTIQIQFAGTNKYLVEAAVNVAGSNYTWELGQAVNAWYKYFPDEGEPITVICGASWFDVENKSDTALTFHAMATYGDATQSSTTLHIELGSLRISAGEAGTVYGKNFSFTFPAANNTNYVGFDIALLGA